MAKEVFKKFSAAGKESYFMVTPGVLKKNDKNITRKLNKHFIYI